MESWDDARLFLAVCSAGSLKGASRVLGVHVSTVSRRLELLEENLGTALFDRRPEGVVPTRAAELLMPHAHAMEDAACGMARALGGLEQKPEGRVRVSAPPAVVDYFLAPRLSELLTVYPGLQVDVVSSVEYADLMRREADIAVRVRPPTSPELAYTCVLDRMPSGLFSNRPLSLDTRQLKATRFVTFSDQLGHLDESRWIAAHVSPNQVSFRASTLTTLVEAVRAGAGVAVLPQSFSMLEGLVPAQLSNDLSDLVEELPHTSMYIVVHRALRRVPRIAVVWEAIREVFTAST